MLLRLSTTELQSQLTKTLKLLQMKNQLFTWINEEAEKRDWNNSELARRAKISQSNLSLILSEQRNVTWDFCEAIAKAFGERPEKVFRLAGLLPPSAGQMQDLSEDEGRLVALYRGSSPLAREWILKAVEGFADGKK